MMIADLSLSNRVFLAPMSGVSDFPFRKLAMAYGAGAVVSEMIASEQLSYGEDEAVLKLTGEGISPNIVQLAGREAKWMDKAARIARDSGADVIDINMGCPAKKVTGGYSGSALMRDLDHAMTLVEATVKAVDCPVTLKMRLGWDDQSRNAAELARRAQDAGIKAITVHGRTRCQFYNGNADWPAIGQVKEAISIPLIANGDVINVKDAEAILEITGADGVMIGRGAYGRPWLPGYAAHYLETGEELAAPMGKDLAHLITQHYEALLDHYGDHIGMLAARKHLAWYLDADEGRAEVTSKRERIQLLTSKEPKKVLAMIKQIFESPLEGLPADIKRQVA